ncbi:putative Predicted protein [Thiocapsa sp. KS1]|jgi:hypothetical protein|nr:putative Predicted protein [Thiocapsa sp. KS1]
MSGLMTGRWQRPGLQDRINPVPNSLMVVVENALSYAWRVLLCDVADGKFSLCSAKEDEITEQIQVILGELHAAEPEPVEGFSQLSLGRDGKVRSYDGRRLDLQPDLTFYPLRGNIPTTNTIFAGIFIECKPVDSNHPVSGAYCREGLARFIRGDYAWAVDRALMVAYVRNRCWLPSGLLACIKGAAAHEYGFSGTIEEAPKTCIGDKVFRSVHSRSFPLSGRPVEPIALDHLWLYPSCPCENRRCRGTGAGA